MHASGLAGSIAAPEAAAKGVSAASESERERMRDAGILLTPPKREHESRTKRRASGSRIDDDNESFDGQNKTWIDS